jgi:hypothetical protein
MKNGWIVGGWKGEADAGLVIRRFGCGKGQADRGASGLKS